MYRSAPEAVRYVIQTESGFIKESGSHHRRRVEVYASNVTRAGDLVECTKRGIGAA